MARLLCAAVSCAVVLWLAGVALALEVPPLQGRHISDLAGVLPGNVEEQLNARLAAYEQQTGHQLAVLTVPSLEGDPVEDFTMRVVEAWKLGKKDRDDGVLLLVAVEDKKLRIEVGYGLEGDLPDALAGRIIRDLMTPAFKRGELAEGISAACQAIMAATGGEGSLFAPEPAAAERARRAPRGSSGIFLYLMLAVFLLTIFGGGRGRGGGGSFLAGALLGGLGGRRGGFGGGGGGFGGGGGGGFRGGGGGFGGGGASGSW